MEKEQICQIYVLGKRVYVNLLLLIHHMIIIYLFHIQDTECHLSL